MYIVIEIQTSKEGKVATLVNAYESAAEADSKYYTILAAAALSNVPVHSAVIIKNDGRMVRFESYNHQTEEEENNA